MEKKRSVLLFLGSATVVVLFVTFGFAMIGDSPKEDHKMKETGNPGSKNEDNGNEDKLGGVFQPVVVQMTKEPSDTNTTSEEASLETGASGVDVGNESNSFSPDQMNVLKEMTEHASELVNNLKEFVSVLYVSYEFDQSGEPRHNEKIGSVLIARPYYEANRLMTWANESLTLLREILDGVATRPLHVSRAMSISRALKLVALNAENYTRLVDANEEDTRAKHLTGRRIAEVMVLKFSELADALESYAKEAEAHSNEDVTGSANEPSAPEAGRHEIDEVLAPMITSKTTEEIMSQEGKLERLYQEISAQKKILAKIEEREKLLSAVNAEVAEGPEVVGTKFVEEAVEERVLEESTKLLEDTVDEETNIDATDVRKIALKEDNSLGVENVAQEQKHEQLFEVKDVLDNELYIEMKNDAAAAVTAALAKLRTKMIRMRLKDARRSSGIPKIAVSDEVKRLQLKTLEKLANLPLNDLTAASVVEVDETMVEGVTLGDVFRILRETIECPEFDIGEYSWDLHSKDLFQLNFGKMTVGEKLQHLADYMVLLVVKMRPHRNELFNLVDDKINPYLRKEYVRDTESDGITDMIELHMNGIFYYLRTMKVPIHKYAEMVFLTFMGDDTSGGWTGISSRLQLL